MRAFALLLTAVGGLCLGQNPVAPISIRATRMEPTIVRPGDVVTITGTSLGKDRIEEVYLTDFRYDVRMKVIEQSDGVMKFKVPSVAVPGRQKLMVLTAGKEPVYVELPVYVLVEVDEAQGIEVASAIQH